MKYRFLRFPEGKEKALTLSYDDGTVFDKRLLEIADKYGIKCTLNIYSNGIGWGRCMQKEEIREISDAGVHEIAVHGAAHIAPGIATTVNGIRDVLDCRIALERLTDKIIRGYAYPDSGIRVLTNGESREQIYGYLRELGIAYARTLGSDNNSFAMPENFYAWLPTAHHDNPRLMEYLDTFLSRKLSEYVAARAPMLFFLWGHSYEFNDKNNWEIFEEFCKKAGGQENVWYATNIEIADYVKAYNSLIFNVDNTVVYNPTDKTVWFEADKIIYSVSGGETKTL